MRGKYRKIVVDCVKRFWSVVLAVLTVVGILGNPGIDVSNGYVLLVLAAVVFGIGAAFGYIAGRRANEHDSLVAAAVENARVRAESDVADAKKREEAAEKKSADAAEAARRRAARLSELRGTVMSMEFEDKEVLARLLFYGPVELRRETRAAFRYECRDIISFLCFEPTSTTMDRWDLTSSARDSLGGCNDLLETAWTKLKEDRDKDSNGQGEIV